MNDAIVRVSLWLAFLFNLVAAATLAFPSSWLGQQVGLPDVVSPIYSLLVAFFIALFGIVYAWLARRSVIDRPMLALGCVGKFGAFVIAVGLWLAHEASLLLVVAATGDLAFASMWLVWLRS